MPTTTQYPAITTVGPYTIGFDYANPADILVFLNETLTSSWSLSSPTQVTLTSTPVGSPTLTIQRQTNIDDGNSNVVTFVDGNSSQYSSSILNKAFRTIRYATQEARDTLVTGILKVDVLNRFNAGLRRITNLANGIDNSDAVTLSQANNLLLGGANLNNVNITGGSIAGVTLSASTITGTGLATLNGGARTTVAATVGTDLTNLTTVQTLLQNLFPIGGVSIYAGSATDPVPNVLIVCNGRLLSRTTFATLFSIIGTAFGAGDGSTTFAIPDFRGTTPVGFDSAAATGRITSASVNGANIGTIGGRFGSQTHTLTVPEMPAHTHNVPLTATTTPGGTPPSASLTPGPGVTSGSTGGGGAHSNTQPSMAVVFIMRVA